MKLLLTTVVCFLTLQIASAQSIKFGKDYLKALQYAKKKNASVLFFFVNGKDTYTEENIEDNVLKSSNFKNAINHSLVIVTVDESNEESKTKFNKRMITAYNEGKIFPSIKVYNPNSRKRTSLLTSFNDKDIIAFIEEINNLKN